uniref:Ig-like domain-containing protein n=1 Tax=Knipowitschia caucasica TaxID=637954 RepID=A0AAV2J5Z9_KNICA
MVEKYESMPQIMQISQRLTDLHFGDKLTLNCTAQGEPTPRIMWRLPSKALVDHWHRMGSRIHVLENGTLIINSVSDKDAGEYLCVARNIIGDDLQLLTVRVSMKPAKIERKLHDKKQVTFGKDLKVDCKASGAPKPEISWGLPDGTVVNNVYQSDGRGAVGRGGRMRRYTLFDNGTLYLNQVSMSEEGDYTCYAENQVGKDEMHVHITVVTSAPHIHAPTLARARVKVRGNVRLDCHAVGEPKPKILWMLPSKDVIAASNDRYLVHVNGSLDIREVKFGDVGDYICMARNPADGNPRPTISWTIPGGHTMARPQVLGRYHLLENGTLTIHDTTAHDKGSYMCRARNDAGEAVLTVPVVIIAYPPRITAGPPASVRAIRGAPLQLPCVAVGIPKAEITWELPDHTLLSTAEQGQHIGKVSPESKPQLDSSYRKFQSWTETQLSLSLLVTSAR